MFSTGFSLRQHAFYLEEAIRGQERGHYVGPLTRKDTPLPYQTYEIWVIQGS